MIIKVLASLIMVHLVTIFATFFLYLTIKFRKKKLKYVRKDSHADSGGHFF